MAEHLSWVHSLSSSSTQVFHPAPVSENARDIPNPISLPPSSPPLWSEISLMAEVDELQEDSAPPSSMVINPSNVPSLLPSLILESLPPSLPGLDTILSQLVLKVSPRNISMSGSSIPVNTLDPDLAVSSPVNTNLMVPLTSSNLS
ncbi:hypothetical protein HMI54_010892 [Coelomomyces lativittatus]|nr:hypothetical protein HMI54_010892 [Coelomomyces lativittatus]KAJ1501722.1 hypothetical protein HMI56_003079 [Coelomomyces lativittatus]